MSSLFAHIKTIGLLAGTLVIGCMLIYVVITWPYWLAIIVGGMILATLYSNLYNDIKRKQDRRNAETVCPRWLEQQHD